jgi:hypothetical protein
MVTKNKKNGMPREFSEKTIACLRKAGWSPQKLVDTEVYTAAYHEEGVELLQGVMTFLSHFGGLVVSYTNSVGQHDELDFLANEAVEGFGNGGNLKFYQTVLSGTELCPVGHYHFGMCVLLMDNETKLYGAMDRKLFRIGNGFAEAIDNIIMCKGVTIVWEAKQEHQHED